MSLADVEAGRRCYVEGYGETTVGEIRATEQEPALDEREETIKMWGWIVTHPDEPRPWRRNTGRSRAASGESTA